MKLLAFLKRDFYIQTSYKLSFLWQIVGIFTYATTFFFISKLFGKSAIPYLESYGGDYFSFVLIGIAFSGYMSTSLHSFSGALRNEQVNGTIESVLVSPTSLATILVGSSLWNFCITTLEVLVYLITGVFIFDLKLHNSNIPGAIIIVLLTIISFSSVGIMASSFVLIFKRGDPITWAITTFSELFGGVYFPTTLIPSYLQWITYLLPITYSLNALRHALLQGWSTSRLLFDIWILILFSAITLPLASLMFKIALNRVKKDGSLLQY